jgi:uncharacterized protein (TIGR03067 family)
MLRVGLAAVLAVGLVGLAAGGNPPPTTPPGDLGTLQGYWKPLSVQFEGKPQMPAEEQSKITVVVDQSEYHLYYADKTVTPPKVLRLALMNVSVDASTNPKSIEFTFADGPLKGQKRHGIYEIAGNQLKLCYGPVEKPKPATFTAPGGSGYFLEVWAKQPQPMK